jgi:hypothetical protein
LAERSSPVKPLHSIKSSISIGSKPIVFNKTSS